MCTGEGALQRAGLHHRAMSAGRYHVLFRQGQVFGHPAVAMKAQHADVLAGIGLRQAAQWPQER